MDIQVIPISKEYVDNYSKIFCNSCKGKIVYGSDTETGRLEIRCKLCPKIIVKEK